MFLFAAPGKIKRQSCDFQTGISTFFLGLPVPLHSHWNAQESEGRFAAVE
jgi:hypothetical protein